MGPEMRHIDRTYVEYVDPQGRFGHVHVDKPEAQVTDEDIRAAVQAQIRAREEQRPREIPM